MRTTLLAATLVALAGAAVAQTPSSLNEPGTRADGTHAPSRVSPGPPLDRGPTPGSDAAHNGGAVILQGVPGAPAPAPQPTPSVIPAR
ncbi:hypothetical protein [Muricoccus radiodurans]|uniref:hypothetical protein n=1 Tax=Muricoccus radiodurans TaxID=2231721 RepID=UPI003CF470C0